MEYYVIALVILVFFSAFFSSAETAFLSLSDSKVNSLIKEGKRNANLIKKLKSDPRSFLITVLIGNNLVNIGAASLATVVFSHYFNSAVIGVTTAVMTTLVLIFGEIVPKSFATSNTVFLATTFAPVIMFLKKIFLPIIFILDKITILLVGGHKAEKVSEDELKALAMTGVEQGTIERNEGLMIENLFKFNDITAEDVMTPRVELVFVESGASIEEAAIEIENHGITRCLVVEGSPDKIKGFVHAQDVLLAFRENKEKEAVETIMLPIIVVPKQMIISNVLKEFQKRKIHIAVVLDEYGGTDGIITLEDTIEELVGEIIDEHDVDKNLMKRIGKNEVVVSGVTEVRDLNRFLNINFADDDLDTVSDVILSEIKKIPKEGMKIRIKDYECTIEKVENKIIKSIRIIK